MAALTATIAQTANVAEDLALELEQVSVALRDLNSTGWNFGIWDLPECRNRVAQLRQAALDVQTVALQLSQTNDNLVALNHRAGITQDQVAAVANAQNNPAQIDQLDYDAARHTLLRRLAAARTSTRAALAKLAEGVARVDTLEIQAAANNAQQGLQNNAGQPLQQQQPALHVQLPKIELQVFRGDNKPPYYRNWRTLFDELVHNVVGLGDRSKLGFLTQSLDVPLKPW
jgi:hypothetical protein